MKNKLVHDAAWSLKDSVILHANKRNDENQIPIDVFLNGGIVIWYISQFGYVFNFNSLTS